MSLFSGFNNLVDKIKERFGVESKPSVYRFAAATFKELNDKYAKDPERFPINYTIGSPTEPIHTPILEKAIDFLHSVKEKVLDYTNFQGNEEIRKRAVAAFSKEHGLEEGKYNENHVILTAGANGGIELVLNLSKKLLGHSKVLMPHPTFGSYIPMAQEAGLEVCLMDTTEDKFATTKDRMRKSLYEMMDQDKSRLQNYIDNVDLIKQNIKAVLPEMLTNIEEQTGYKFSKEQKEIYKQIKKGRIKDQTVIDKFHDSISATLDAEKDKLTERLSQITPQNYSCLALLPDPCNPTGKKQDRKTLEGIADLMEEFPNVVVCGDHLYRGLTFKGNTKDTLFDVMRERGMDLRRYIYVDSMSKTDSIAAERCGGVYCLLPELPAAMANKQLIKNVHPGYSAQVMYAEAMETRHLYEQRNADAYEKKMDLLSSGLVKMAIVDPEMKPNSTFYHLVPDLDFMKDLKLTPKELGRVKEFNPHFDSEVVGHDPMAASVVLAYRMHIVTTAMYIPSGENVDYVGTDGKIPVQKADVRMVPALPEKHIEASLERLGNFKQAIEKGNVSYSLDTPENAQIEITNNVVIATMIVGGGKKVSG